MSINFDVIVVGGGAAGVGAARRLAEHGASTLLLEANSRLGGRAWTHEVGGFPLDLGCGWLHSADRNAWVGVAEEAGFAVDRCEPPWGKPSAGAVHPEGEQRASRQAFDDWDERLGHVDQASDRASDAMDPNGPWNGHVRAMTGYISRVGPEAISVADYLAYETASTGRNWRVPLGYGTLVAAGLPPSTTLRVATPAERIDVEGDGVSVTTRAGIVRARAAILTVSTSVLSSGAIRLPAGLDPWLQAASVLPLGRNEKVFLEIQGASAMEVEGHVFGSLHDARTAAYHIRPYGRPVIEGFLGGDGARILEREGPAAAYAHAMDELAALFGSDMRASLRPLAASDWGRMGSIGGGYSCALPGHAAARASLARPYEDRLFLAGEATHAFDFSTAHAAHDSGMRAADEVHAVLRTAAC